MCLFIIFLPRCARVITREGIWLVEFLLVGGLFHRDSLRERFPHAQNERAHEGTEPAGWNIEDIPVFLQFCPKERVYLPHNLKNIKKGVIISEISMKIVAVSK